MHHFSDFIVVVALVVLAVVEGRTHGMHEEVMVLEQNSTSNLSPLPSSSSSQWFRRVKNPRAIGCWKRPWICRDGKYPPFIKKLCCKNRCVDVTSDMNNCGLCGIRCPFTWQCCNGLCIDTNVNPFHCGKCWNKCAFGSFCFYGMCGYALPLPPFPFPLPPKIPLPPFPFPPKPPKPPLPPFPFPPKPPKPWPPKPPLPPFPFPPKPPKPWPPKPPKPWLPKPPKPFPPKPPKELVEFGDHHLHHIN